jgi:hypothetical protein
VGRDAFLPKGTAAEECEAGDFQPLTVPKQRTAVDQLPSTVDGPRTTIGGQRSLSITQSAEREPWEAQHKRVTFYCPTELLARIEAEMDRSGRSKTAVIVDAVRADLPGQ